MNRCSQDCNAVNLEDFFFLILLKPSAYGVWYIHMASVVGFPLISRDIPPGSVAITQLMWPQRSANAPIRVSLYGYKTVAEAFFF